MPSKTAILTVSVPQAMLDQVEKLRTAEQRTRSEFVREALRLYFARAAGFPEAVATAAEIRALKRGQREIASGKFVTLDQLRHEFATLDAARRPRSRKKSPTRARR